jgi:hypothetical protein
MPKTAIFLAAFLTSVYVNAQPNFTLADMPDIGDIDTIWNLAAFVNNHDLEKETGNGSKWDFSDIPIVFAPIFALTDTFRVKTAKVSLPVLNATIEEWFWDHGAPSVNLFSTGNDTLYIHRVGTVENGFVYDPALASIAFPIEFGKASTIDAEIGAGRVKYGRRLTTALYDGFGTLTLPKGQTYTNVFRIKKTERDTSYYTPTISSKTRYIWYKQGGQIPLLTLEYSGLQKYYSALMAAGNNGSAGILSRGNSPRRGSIESQSGAGPFKVAYRFGYKYQGPNQGLYKLNGERW